MRRLTTAIVLFAGLAIMGCGETPTGDVSGTITYDGKPVEEGSIAFIPIDGNGPTAGAAIKGGKYTALKVPAGQTKVKINGAKETGSKRMYDDPNSPVVKTSTEYLPAKYHDATELRYEVVSGQQTKDFDLAK